MVALSAQRRRRSSAAPTKGAKKTLRSRDAPRLLSVGRCSVGLPAVSAPRGTAAEASIAFWYFATQTLHTATRAGAGMPPPPVRGRPATVARGSASRGRRSTALAAAAAPRGTELVLWMRRLAENGSAPVRRLPWPVSAPAVRHLSRLSRVRDRRVWRAAAAVHWQRRSGSEFNGGTLARLTPESRPAGGDLKGVRCPINLQRLGLQGMRGWDDGIIAKGPAESASGP